MTEEKSEKYYKYQIRGLILILLDGIHEGSTTIHRNYVIEKLSRIFSGDGVSFHPTLKEKLDEEFNDSLCLCGNTKDSENEVCGDCK